MGFIFWFSFLCISWVGIGVFMSFVRIYIFLFLRGNFYNLEKIDTMFNQPIFFFFMEVLWDNKFLYDLRRVYGLFLAKK